MQHPTEHLERRERDREKEKERDTARQRISIRGFFLRKDPLLR